MQIQKMTLVGTCLVLGLAAGCGNSSTSAAGRSDEDIEKAIQAEFDSNAELQAYDIDVDADAEKHTVTLSGTVPTEKLRMLAVDEAKIAGADLQINDELEVKPGDVARTDYTEEMAQEARSDAKKTGEQIGKTLDDAWIHTKVRAKLAGEGELPFGGINVDVVNNVVTLRGTVDSSQDKAEAARIAMSTDGVKQVRNQLMVKSGE